MARAAVARNLLTMPPPVPPANQLVGAAADPVPQSVAMPGLGAAATGPTAVPVAQALATAQPAVAPSVAPAVPPVDPAGEAMRVSTRIPESAKAPPPTNPHQDAQYVAGAHAMRSVPASWATNIEHLKRLAPDINMEEGPDGEKLDTEGAAEAFTKHVKGNLKWLYDQYAPYRERSKLWYVGAHRIARDMASEFGVTHRQAAAVLASMSPQKDWFQNVDLARRVLTIRRDMGDMPVTPKMREQFARFVETAGTVSKPSKDPEKLAAQQAKATASAAKMAAQVAAIGGKSFNALTQNPYQQALWLRAHDEAHNSRDYRIVTPEGEYAGPAGRKVSWGSFGEITKALSSLREDSHQNISENLGSNHKVRNFFNNIIAPLAPHGDVTIDTHAIAAAHLRALGASSALVDLGLGTGGSYSKLSGMGGAYGLYADAYRSLARDLGIQPRELQSITWEAVRGLFSDTQKRDKAFVRDVDNIWHQHRSGEINAEQARRAILQRSAPGGIRAPQWA